MTTVSPCFRVGTSFCSTYRIPGACLVQVVPRSAKDAGGLPHLRVPQSEGRPPAKQRTPTRSVTYNQTSHLRLIAYRSVSLTVAGSAGAPARLRHTTGARRWETCVHHGSYRGGRCA
jgi:hypothetical protein